ncbi:MAG: prolipoprotein diacylglyceryl transferase [Deltaproteobacteria bacterium]|nr:prolipoprotein diacylglyceryl transferase [Deltaproteobacteria bacterium]
MDNENNWTGKGTMNPILFKIGPVEIRWYGTMIALAYLVGLWLARREARRKGLDPLLMEEFSYIVLPAALIGARLYYVLFSDAWYFLQHPLKILAFWEGGLAIHGAILGGAASALWFTHRKGIPFLRWADTLAPSVVLGQAIGRIGCFINGDAFGVPTQMPWGVVFSPDSPAGAQFPSPSLPNFL